jgi:STE24 endopeptidase
MKTITLCCLLLLTLTAVAQPPTQPLGANENPATRTQDPVVEYRLPPDKLEKAAALYHTRVTLFVAGTLYGLGVLALALWWRIGARFRDWAERASRRRFLQALVFVPLVVATIDALTLPFSAYAHHMQVRYGLSVQGWGSWFWDWTKGELVGAALSTLAVWGLYAILRRSPKRWWLYAWLAAMPYILVVALLQPLVIAPLFNKFEPLAVKQPQLLVPLEKVMARGGLQIERARMFEMQASDKVTTYNAYVTGIGASKRVVVWDNTARDLTEAETMFVFGHEQGHYVLHHIWLSLALIAAGLLVALYLGYRTIGPVLARFGPRWQVRELADWASLPVLILALNLFVLVTQPVAAAYSRNLEHQADVYAVEAIHGLVADSPQAAARAFQKLGEKSLSYPNPHPLYVFWTFSHPPLAERIKFANEYRPWAQGGALEYFNE